MQTKNTPVEQVINAETNEVLNNVILTGENNIRYRNRNETMAVYNTSTGSMAISRDWDGTQETAKYTLSFVAKYTPYGTFSTVADFEARIKQGGIVRF